ncbi:ATP-dependent helicase HrpB [Shewanella dokdonensis]|uniref:ATP-dependent helicase HrpB n=1 Tax=Shewanella dokdonensis TaxID=712036 RepID=A0ABX8DJ46_9GAMM|nr:ATP-dependent helicase HrpB [Shewanella dokdonensis]MCL1074290.1 ATP-dependent helicase HrpB [Shewanella dokdonensis]QVK23991.1 ATP-dependent helicase HrpB [Shewanella dokdonensis]
MDALPINSLLPELRQALASVNRIILQAPTGAGKSTALPLALLDWPEINGRILMLEPRRVAARSIAAYLARCRQQPLGQTVGYRVRGETHVSRNTKLEIITEGILTRMIQQDPTLDGVAMVIFDEIHERHLTTDLGLALALEVQTSVRDDLKILAMSATLQGVPLAQLLPDACTLTSEGRSFPITIGYRAVSGHQQERSALPAWLSHMGKTIVAMFNGTDVPELNDVQRLGSMLAFLPGRAEILKLQEYLTARLPDDIQLYLMYGDLPAALQDAAIAPPMAGKRKLVLSTNVAESSLTIEGITMVVDSGYRRQASFNPRTGVTRLGLKRISQASAQQRAGRAGRVAAGFCMRLWSQEEQGRLAAADDPEILTGELLPMVFEAANWGVKSLAQLPLLTPANEANEAVAWELLQALELVDAQHKLTEHGRAAYQFGATSPRLAHMVVKASALVADNADKQLLGLACLLAALLEARSRGSGCDVLDQLPQLLRGPEVKQAKQWLRRCQLAEEPASYLKAVNYHDVALLLALAFPDRIAKARGAAGFVLANGTGVTLERDAALASADWLVVADFQEQEGRSSGRVYLATMLPAALLDNELAFLCQWQDEAGWDDSKGRFLAERQRRLGKLILKREPLPQLDNALKCKALLALIRQRSLSLLNMDDRVRQLQFRLRLAQSTDPTQFPEMSDTALLTSLEQWLAPYLDDVSQLKQLATLDIYSLLLNCLSWQARQQLDEWLPTHWPMATGTRAPIRYDESGRALLSVRLQEALGMSDSPRLLQGKLVITMELLSPAHRPLALTADLASFWQGPYTEVKKEMRGRYPKHLWPDDPANTLPTKYTKKRTEAKPS